MNSFLTEWSKDLKSIPVGPLGIVAMNGCQDMGSKVNAWLQTWRSLQKKKSDSKDSQDDNPEMQNERYYTQPGGNRNSFLIDYECPRFGTGESKGLVKESVRGLDIYIIVDVCAYDVTYKMYGEPTHMSPDDHFQDLKRVIAAIAGKAKRVNVIMPMLYESRQHKRSARESLDCALALQELSNYGVDNIITFDAHDPRVANAVPLIGFENVMPTYQMMKALCRVEKGLAIDKENMMVVSPDEGAMQRNIFYSSVLGLELGMFYKLRDYTTIIDGMNPIKRHEYLGSSVAGKDIIVVDDMISSGESLLDVCKELKNRGANHIFALSTFAFFTKGIEKFDRAYQEGILTKVIATNLTYRRPELASAPWFAEADLSKYVSYIIATLNHDRSLEGLLNPYTKIKKLLAKYQAEQAEAGIRLV